MPELPEVETLRRELDKSLSGHTIKKVAVLNNKTVLPLSPITFQKKLSGLKIISTDRRAKMLILNLSKEYFLIFHLKMTGQLIFVPSKGEKISGGPTSTAKRIISGGHPTKDVQTPGKHTRIIFTLDNNSHLYFNDMRKFGWAKLVDKQTLAKMTRETGPEPLSTDFTVEYLINIFQKYPNRTIKQILLDQTMIAGIGNIYADESCFLSGLRPDRKVETLSNNNVKKLYDELVGVLKLSIKHGGTSSRNYRRSDGTQGGFVPRLYVYGREKDPCKVCGGKLVKIRHAGRGTHYCTKCQV